MRQRRKGERQEGVVIITVGARRAPTASRVSQRDSGDTVAVDERSAERIARTEMNRVSNAAELAQYRQNNIKYYRFIATEDARTCEICGKLHDTVHATDAATPGENFPPVHPNCRCRTVISTVDENGNEDDSWLDDMQAEIDALQAEFDEMDEDEERAQKESEIERDAEEQLQAVEDIDKKLKTIDEDIRRLDDFGEVLIVPMASITASEIEEVSIDIREQEIKVAELQQRAAALDDAVPKVDDKFIETLKYKQEEAKQRHDERIEKDTFGKENFMLALQNFPEYTEPTVSNDIEPKSHIGKLWQKVCHAVGKAKEWLFEEIKRFGKRIQDVQETFNTFKDWFEEIIGMFQPALAMAGGGSIRPNGLLMTTGSNAQPTNEQTEQPKQKQLEQPSDKKKAKRGTSDAAMAAKRVPAHGLAQNDVGKNIGLKKDGAKPVYQVAEEIIIPDNKRSHIFTQKHFGEIPFEDAERKILEIIRNKDNYIGTSGYWRQANDWYVEIDKNGGQWWVKINENGQIEDAGYNPPNKPRTWKNHGGLAQN